MADDRAIRRLKARAAEMRAASSPRRRRPNFVEGILLEEIDKALGRRDRATLAALDRLREASGLPADPRVHRFLRIADQARALINREGNAA